MFISIMLGIWGLVNLFYFNLDLFFLLKRIKLKRVFMKSCNVSDMLVFIKFCEFCFYFIIIY